MTSATHYVPLMTLLTQDNAKLLQQLKSRFKKTINWNKYHSITAKYDARKHYEDFTTIINEERNYRELKESIRIMKSQASDTEKNTLIEEDKRKSIDEIFRQNA